MNIFLLDEDHGTAAEMYVDRHVVKIITEINQALSTCYPNGFAPYKHSHYNHPICRWIRTSLENFHWAVKHNQALCREYTHRYDKRHRGEKVLNFFLKNTPQLDDRELTPFFQCFGAYQNICQSNNPIDGYRKYYLLAKRHLFSWKRRQIPLFVQEFQVTK